MQKTYFYLVTIVLLDVFALFSNLNIFTNRVHLHGNPKIIITLQSIPYEWFTTTVTLNERILLDYFQTNKSERQESLLWYKTKTLKKTLSFFGISNDTKLPYEQCFFHICRANFLSNGFYNINVLIINDGLFKNETKRTTNTFVRSNLHISCVPQIDISRCHDSNRPLHYETSKVIVLRAFFLQHCPMDNFIQYYWTLHDSTESDYNLYYINIKTNVFSGNRVIIPAYSQPNNQTLKIILLIRSTFDTLRTAITKQIIVFSSSRRLINLNVVCVSNCNGRKYTVELPIHLKGQCLSCINKKITTWQWRVDNTPVEGASKRLIFHAMDSKKRKITINLNVEAVNRYNSNIIYYGSTLVTMEKNIGPSNSNCTIYPRIGRAQETQFYLQCRLSQARFKPLQYCIGVNNFLIDECRTDEKIVVRLPPTERVTVMICDNLYVCHDVTVYVDVRRFEIEDTDMAFNESLSQAQYLLEYADWGQAFLLLYQVAKLITSNERVMPFIKTLYEYQPHTSAQLTHLVRLTKRVVLSLEPLDDMDVSAIARMLNLISSTFKIVIGSNELNTLMDTYYETMVNELWDILNKFNSEWEYVPKSQCRAESESCLNIDNFRNRLEQMSTLRPQGLEHINNWLHAHWKLSSCLFYVGMGTARRLHPEEGPKLLERSTFNIRMESFDLDNEGNIEFESADSMHTIVFTDKLLQEMRQRIRTDEILIFVRSHKHSQYWWYPEQDAQTQVLVVNAFTKNYIWQKTEKVLEPFQYISKLKMNFSAGEYVNDESNPQRFQRGIDFDDPEEDVENVIHDNVYTPFEVRMYRTELYAHSVIGVTFTQADIDYYVLIRMTNVPKLEDMETDSTCLVKTGLQQPTTLLLRNHCKKSRPVYIYVRAANLSESWNSFSENGAFFSFSTEIRSCRVWKYERPEPSWQKSACLPEMNKSIYFGIHCKCNYIGDFDADAMPIIALPMNIKCHIERPVVGINYEMIFFFFTMSIFSVLYLFLNMARIKYLDKRLYVETYERKKFCYRGDILIKFTFGGRYNAGTSANIIFSFKSFGKLLEVIVYQDQVIRNFQRNNTFYFRLRRQLIRLPTQILLRHDYSGIYPHFFCRTVIICDTLTEQTQSFRFQQWVKRSNKDIQFKSAKIFYRGTTADTEIHRWKPRFSKSVESYMGNWYLFQPIIGPWRFGIFRLAFCRWERSCIFIVKLFFSICLVVIFFGKTEPIACDPSPQKYNDINVVVRLCIICFIVSCFVQTAMETVFEIVGIYDFV
ncbi:hypothetical protein KR032_006882 [Drosophila birchii]|nr:hypothetical protein KR032_006882 [Drosophila birchii]